MPSQRQTLLAGACTVLLVWVVYSLSRLPEHYTYDLQARPAQAHGPMKAAGGAQAASLVRHAGRDLDGLAPDPALSRLLANVAPTQLGTTAATGPWAGGG